MRLLSSRNKTRLLELLSARLAFERLAVRLHQAALARVGTDAPVASVLPGLRRVLEEEREHATWLEGQIAALGRDPTARSPAAALAELEARGLREAILDPDRSLADVFHALLALELIDHAGWHVLLLLADEADDEEARLELRKRIWQEDEHLNLIRAVVQSDARAAVLEKVVRPAAA